MLTGQAAEGEQRFAYELALPESADDAGVALLWAQRRIADLLTELRVEGRREGLIEEIIAIANQFGIVTPYTSLSRRGARLRLQRARRDGRHG